MSAPARGAKREARLVSRAVNLYQCGQCRAESGALDEEALHAELHGINAAECDPPLEGVELTRTLAKAVIAIANADREYLTSPAATALEITAKGRQLRDIRSECLEALVKANERPEPVLFQRSSELVRVRENEDGRPVIQAHTDESLRGRLTEVADFVTPPNASGTTRPIAPPKEVVSDLRTLTAWPAIPALAAIIEAPTIRVDGSLLDTPGYDATSRLYYQPAPGLAIPHVPEHPTGDEVAAAVALLRSDLLGDFPFVTAADEANALALLVTPIVRPNLRCVPLALLDAPRAGTGKGLLASVAARIATGRAAAVFPAPDDDREWGKSITSMLDGGATWILIDEARDLRSPRLSAALTADTYTDRRLGHSEMIDVPQRATWAAAGNNVALGGDMPRRCYRIRLDPKTARPWTRNGWRHPDLEEWVTAHRGKLLGALLTITRAWHAAGRPAGQAPTIGGFTQWAETVGGVLTHAGVTGFLGNLPDLYDHADDDASQWEAFLDAIDAAMNGQKFTTGHLAGLIGDAGAITETLPDELAPKLLTPGFKVTLGKALRARVDTRHGENGLHLIHAGQDSHARTPQWQVATDRSAGGAGGLCPPLCTRASKNRRVPLGLGHTPPATLRTPRKWMLALWRRRRERPRRRPARRPRRRRPRAARRTPRAIPAGDGIIRRRRLARHAPRRSVRRHHAGARCTRRWRRGPSASSRTARAARRGSSAATLMPGGAAPRASGGPHDPGLYTGGAGRAASPPPAKWAAGRGGRGQRTSPGARRRLVHERVASVLFWFSMPHCAGRAASPPPAKWAAGRGGRGQRTSPGARRRLVHERVASVLFWFSMPHCADFW